MTLCASNSPGAYCPKAQRCVGPEGDQSLTLKDWEPICGVGEKQEMVTNNNKRQNMVAWMSKWLYGLVEWENTHFVGDEEWLHGLWNRSWRMYWICTGRQECVCRGGRTVFHVTRKMSSVQLWKSAQEWEREQEEIHFILRGCIIQRPFRNEKSQQLLNRKKLM